MAVVKNIQARIEEYQRGMALLPELRRRARLLAGGDPDRLNIAQRLVELVEERLAISLDVDRFETELTYLAPSDENALRRAEYSKIVMRNKARLKDLEIEIPNVAQALGMTVT